MAWLSKIIGVVGSFILEKIIKYILDKISRKIAKEKESQDQLKIDEDNAKRYSDSKSDEERHKSGENVLNGD